MAYDHIDSEAEHFDEHFRDECGVFGIWNHEEAARLTYLGLYALQHRGQESAGIVTLDNGRHSVQKGLGLVHDVFPESILKKMSGSSAIGHVRYSTTGGNILGNAQPLVAEMGFGPLALGHNGNITNAEVLRSDLIRKGAIFQGTNDTEVVLHLIARSTKSSITEKIHDAFSQLVGAFSMVVMTNSALYAVRDSLGFRPLVLGRLKKVTGGYSPVLASETCALDLIGAEYDREIKPGEILCLDQSGEKSIELPEQKWPGQVPAPKSQHSKCVFEHVYFARPDSVVFGRSVYETRKRAGSILARENPVAADLVVPMPDSGVPAAIGYSQASHIPFELGIIRNHYVGRTFIEPEQKIRSFGVKIKLNPQTAVLTGKRVIVVDDSLVRGTTSQKIIGLVRAAGATEVHLRIAAPPTISPCFYGVDTPQKSELIASQKSVDEICRFVGADSLGFLSMPGLFEAVQGSKEEFCTACFSGNYPTPIESQP